MFSSCSFDLLMDNIQQLAEALTNLPDSDTIEVDRKELRKTIDENYKLQEQVKRLTTEVVKLRNDNEKLMNENQISQLNNEQLGTQAERAAVILSLYNNNENLAGRFALADKDKIDKIYEQYKRWIRYEHNT